MNHLRLFTTIPLLVLSSCVGHTSISIKEVDPSSTYDDVYLIMGQSNATGVAEYRFLANSHPDVLARYRNGVSHVQICQDVDERVVKSFQPTALGMGHNEIYFGPEIGIAETLRGLPEVSYLIKATLSGSCLQSQYVDRFGFKYELYTRFIGFIKGQLQSLKEGGKNPRLRGLFWMQGESDACSEISSTYLEAMKYFYEYILTELHPWIYGHFNFVDAYIDAEGIWPNYMDVNKAKQDMAALYPDYYCIHTNGEDENAINLVLKSESGEGEDAAHYDSSSMLLLGHTAATYLVK